MIHVRAKKTTVFIRVTFTLHVLDPCAPHRTSKDHSHRPARARQPKLTEPSRVRGEGSAASGRAGSARTFHGIGCQHLEPGVARWKASMFKSLPNGRIGWETLGL